LECLQPNRTRINGDVLLSTLQRLARALGGRLVVTVTVSRSAGMCCDMMAGELRAPCPDHEPQAACPDRVITRTTDGAYGLPVHDGGTSYITITYCPWCGCALVDP
jgi:hypothetical protein